MGHTNYTFKSAREIMDTPPDNVVHIDTGYKPRKLQQSIHNLGYRFKVLVCHRRFGKTVLTINELIDRALNNPLRNPQYAYVCPTYRQAKKVAWQYLLDYSRFLPNVSSNITELTVIIKRPDRICPLTGKRDPDHIKIMLLGADDPDDLRGMYLDGVILDEYSQCDPNVWGMIIRHCLADRKKIAYQMGIIYDNADMPIDPWAIFIGTPKGKNHFYKRYVKATESMDWAERFEATHDVKKLKKKWAAIEAEHKIDEDTSIVELEAIMATWPTTQKDEFREWTKYSSCKNWYAVLYKARETGILSRDEIQEMMEDLTPEQVEQELDCSFHAAILGSYWGHLLGEAHKDQRVGKVPYNPKYPVDTYWDIGVGDKASIWFLQKIGKSQVNYIHYYEAHGKGVDHYIKVLDALAGKGRVEVDSGEFISGRGFKYGRHVWPHDGRVKEWGTGQTRQETARGLGLIVEIQEKQAVDDRIQAGRNRIKISLFDEDNCKRGLECLYNYQKEWDEKLLIFKEKPKHDWSSHGADAFGYSALDDRPSKFEWERTKNLQQKAIMEYDEFNVG